MNYATAVSLGLCPRCLGARLPEWGTRVHCPTCLEVVAEKMREATQRPGYYAARYRRIRARTDARATCVDCGQPRDGEAARCRNCTVANSSRTMDSYDARKAAGLCPKCGGAREGAAVWCDPCRVKQADRRRAREARAT